MDKNIRFSILFIVLTLLITWVYIFIIFSNPKTVGLFHFCMFFPAIIGITINSIRYQSIKKVFHPITVKINAKSLLFSFFYPIIFLGIIALLVKVTNLAEFDRTQLYRLFDFRSIIFIPIGLLLMFGEEYGWRGFLLKELTESIGNVWGSFVVGVVWATWHSPIIYGLALHNNMENPILLTLLQFVAVLVISYPFSYSYLLSKNVLPPMILHFTWNYYNPIVLGNIYQNVPGIMKGNISYINGEGLAGIMLGLIFMIWFNLKYSTKY
ncbi:CPBP family intramembrane glutamic endopeptidase [Candidatus Neomarinimicrobiota bacterium]